MPISEMRFQRRPDRATLERDYFLGNLDSLSFLLLSSSVQSALNVNYNRQRRIGLRDVRLRDGEFHLEISQL